MQTVPHYVPRARYFDSNGDPLALGRVSFYFPSTTTLKTIYTSRDGTVQAANPVVLDSEGYVPDGGIWYGTGEYKIVVEESDGVGGYTPLWTIDGVPGADALPTGDVGDITFIRTISDLEAVTADTYGAAYVFGYYDENDNGGGWFLWDSTSSATPDGGSVIAPIGVPAQGRWIRVFNSDTINANQWGAIGGMAGAANSALTAMMDYAVANNKVAVISTGDYTLSGSLNFTGAFTLKISSGAHFASTTATVHTLTISCDDCIVEGIDYIVDDTINLTWIPVSKRDAYIEWWGIGSGIETRTVFDRAVAVGKIILTGVYSLDADDEESALSFTIDRAHFKRGSYITISQTGIPVITFNDYSADDGISDIFQGRYDKIWVQGSQICMNHFNNALASSANYGYALYAITNGTVIRTARVYWDYRTLTTINFSYISTTAYMFSSEIVNGTVLKFEQPAFIGYVVNGPESIFATTASSGPLISNHRLLLQWWSGNFSDYLDYTDDAIVAAYLTQAENYSAVGSWTVIDGLKGNYRIRNTVTLSNLGASFILHNADLIADNNIGNDVPMMNIAAPSLFKNCDIYTLSNNHIKCTNSATFDGCEFGNVDGNQIVIGTVGGTNISDVKITNCNFVNNSGSIEPSIILYGVTKANISNCNFTALSSIQAYKLNSETYCTTIGYMSNCICTSLLQNSGVMLNGLRGRWQINNCSFYNQHLEVEANSTIYGSTSIRGCKFTDYGLVIRTGTSEATTDVIITDNTFKNIIDNTSSVSKIIFVANSSNTYANGIIVKNNIFDWQYTFASSIDIIQTTNYATYGHLRCEVKDNVCRGTSAKYAGTDQHYRISPSGGSVTEWPPTSLPVDGSNNIYSQPTTKVLFRARIIPISAIIYVRGNNQSSVDSDFAVSQPLIGYGGSSPFIAWRQWGTTSTTNYAVWGMIEWNNANMIQDPTSLY